VVSFWDILVLKSSTVLRQNHFVLQKPMITGRSKISQSGPVVAFVPKQRRAGLFAGCAALMMAWGAASTAAAFAADTPITPDGSPANKIKIVAVTGSTPYRKWPRINEAESQFVTLTAGQRYDFELRQWQGGGSTQLHVRWQLPDGSEERPIPAFRFALPDK
jgi:hypothetical protein